ncbi:hypothetical protein [Halodurantibacterium flavum]|uniref:Uncharacterized protein n=1 Tax=Halodurantibacterium flavum TaxID=1382802 RepID=A0ABW4S4E7_9RHOB
MQHVTFPDVTATVLAVAPDYQITAHLHREPTKKVIITFSAINVGKSQLGFGTEFALKSGHDTVFVAQSRKSQYQGLSLEQFAEAVSPVLGNREIFTYGSSLGGYCAVYYGGIINARIIASAPLNSAHPSIKARNFRGFKFNHIDIIDAPKSSYSPIILFDPHRQVDKMFIDRCIRPAYPDGQYCEFPFAGHTVLETMRNCGVLKEFISSILETGVAPEIKLQSEGNFVWHAERGQYFLAQGRSEEAEQELRKSLSIGVSRIALGGLFRILLTDKRKAEILTVLVDVLNRTEKGERAGLFKPRLKDELKRAGVDWDLLSS